MKKSILEGYALAVCFVTVACGSVALGFGIYDILIIARPEFTMDSYQYARHKTKKEFFPSEGKGFKGESLSEDERTRVRESSWENTLKSEIRGGVQNLVKVFITLVINAVIFLIHWQLARRTRESVVAT